MSDEMGSGTNAAIMALIKDAADPHDRAMLSVMLEITRALESNTLATEAIAKGFHEHITAFNSHRTDFDAHVKEERELFNQGKGMQRVLTWSVSGMGTVMAVIMAMGLYILNGHVDGLNAEHRVNGDQEKRITLIETQPRIMRGEFEDLRNRIFQIEVRLDAVTDLHRSEVAKVQGGLPALSPAARRPPPSTRPEEK